MQDFDTLPLFRQLSPDSLQLLRQGVVTAECQPGSPVLYKSQAISGAYFVLRGRLRVYSLAPNGNEATLYCIAPGETCVFALNSLFNDLRYPAWVQAEQPTTVALVPGPLYRTLFAREDAIRDLTVHTLATLVFRLMRELEQVHAYKLNQRLANLLLLQASAAGASGACPPCATWPSPAPGCTTARWTGSTKSSASWPAPSSAARAACRRGSTASRHCTSPTRRRCPTPRSPTWSPSSKR